MENPNFNTLPEHLQMEILSLLPLQSLGKCLFVSKQWRSLIRSQEFRDLYSSRWMTDDLDKELLDLLLS
ncbi:F-box domain [Arabidopsis suecica]|uniref:F-box domain n=1 Tax=Arabidopsis suecica TaxID=45249 RepID=A0A8T1XNX5_ARASU|nr:F-box domain [Arabidopsis suecica]